MQFKTNSDMGEVKIFKVYISAPIGSGVKTNPEKYKERFDFFESKERFYRERGFEVLNPMKNGVEPMAEDVVHMDADYQLIRKCDIIVMLEGWNRSAGCWAELHYALSIGKEVYLENNYPLI